MQEPSYNIIQQTVKNWENVVSDTRNDVVFEDRNKEYGAYQLRRNHNRIVFIALVATGFWITLLMSIPQLLTLLNNAEEEVEVPVTITNMDLLAPPPIDEKEPPPPPPPPPPVLETVKFTPPVVTDEKIEEPEEILVQQDKEIKIGTVTQEGDGSSGIEITDEVGDGVVETDNTIFMWAEKMPEFPGGYEAMMKFIQKHIVFPQMELEMGISGTSLVQLVVNKDGSITDVKTEKGIPGGPKCDAEAIRVVKLMPKFNPGLQNGRPARVLVRLPIKFKTNQ
jgi:periplasmic protein TonB